MVPSPQYLCSGVTWHGSSPALALESPDGESGNLPLLPGARLAYRIGESPAAKFCLGHHRVHDAEARTHVRCPAQAAADRGYQCGRCIARDDLRFMHDIHRSGIAPEGLKLYLDQPHWLYVATFAGGATKVGTASDLRKRPRLVEQGALSAQYVASADNGRVVRILEDEVTHVLGLTQAVRSSAKAAALLAPLTAKRLDRINGEHAAAARDLLANDVGIGGFTVVQEPFLPPASWSAVLAAQQLQPYPEPLDTGEHGFTLGPMIGSCALVLIDGSTVPFLADLSHLKGRRIEPGNYATAIPAVQESLF
ncbi:DUF2797 domain-containing protein [Arthrobacter sp. Br18]|uniref:DUF2797 domain-containing protein n=1 Tax=Arthrobacter sp. Br18 TaxID=1312954 RepID=UPI000560EEF3|nr:DUF2797 domain-containing protein [Arthrobacter sp. Br18]